jgi:ribulose-5-phosphate 4-epimerase/fuculose-1-phosphate aldolase
MAYEELKYEVAVANRVLSEIGLCTGPTMAVGHASLRDPNDPTKFAIKGRGYEMDALARMRPEDMVVCDMDGRKVDGPPGVTQCFEVKMHSCIYRDHPNVKSVVHVHPRYTILMTLNGVTLRPMANDGAQMVRKPIPMYPHNKLIQSDKDGTEVAALLGGGRTVLLEGHGIATVGQSLQESVLGAYALENQAQANWAAYCAFGPDYRSIPDEYFEEPRERLVDLPHFQDSMKGVQPRVEGVWNYYVDVVKEGM